jgi:integrase/recombinase XerD
VRERISSERARAAAAGVLHRTSRPAARRQPAHDRRLPRQLPAAVDLRAPAHRESTIAAATRDLDATTITAFLAYLENERGNSVRTRNARLTAIHSFFHYAALKAPECAELIARVLSIPEKRYESTLISYLTDPEIDALLAAPDRSTWTGRRDHALLLVAAQTGLRASELASLRCDDLNLGAGWIRCQGKGRKERCTPLSRVARQVLRVWLREIGGDRARPLFPSRNGGHLTRSAIWRLVVKHTATARERCPSLAGKNITPHVLRHYVDGWVMWPAVMFPVVGVSLRPVPAT